MYSCRHVPYSLGYNVFLALISLLFPFLSLVSLPNNFIFHYSGNCENCVLHKCIADVIVFVLLLLLLLFLLLLLLLLLLLKTLSDDDVGLSVLGCRADTLGTTMCNTVYIPFLF